MIALVGRVLGQIDIMDARLVGRPRHAPVQGIGQTGKGRIDLAERACHRLMACQIDIIDGKGQAFAR